MEMDLEYVSSYQGEAYITMLSETALTTDEIGRELQAIAMNNRNAGFTAIGSYMGLNLLVKSEYTLTNCFDHNSFYVEGLNGLKYRYGSTGALPIAFSEKVQYPGLTLQRLPALIETKGKEIAQLENELPVLREILNRTWSKTDELSRLKVQCEALQKKIDDELKKAENSQPVADITDKAA